MIKRIKRTVLTLGILALAGAPIDAHPLPVLIVPPLHYRVLKHIGGGGWYYGINSFPVNESLLRDFRRTARRVGANAVLLRPHCPRSWYCILPFSPVPSPGRLLGPLPPNEGNYGAYPKTFQAYTAEAIRVVGPLCAYPRWLCRFMRPQEIPYHTRLSLYKREWRVIEDDRSYGLALSVAVPGHPRASRSVIQTLQVTSTFSRWGGMAPKPVCPKAQYQDDRWSFPVISLPVLVEVARNGRAQPAQITFLRPYEFYAASYLVTLLRWMHFDLKPVGGRPLFLVADWHLVRLRPHAKGPADVACRYPACPARGCHRGRMAKRLTWRVIAPSNGVRPVAVDPVAER